MRKRAVDLAERSLATFAQAFVAIVLASNVTDLTALKAAAIAGGLAVVKYAGVVANSYLGNPPTGGKVG